MIARIVDNQWIYLDQIALGIEPKIIDHFSVKHPRAHFIDTQQQSWDGYFRKYDAQRRRLARPLLHELKHMCALYDIPLEIRDERPPALPPDPSVVTKDFLPGIILEDYQINAITMACKEEIGIFKLPTGGGKTEVMAGITKLFNIPTCIIAEQRIVIEQIKQRLQLRDIFDVGLFYGGETPSGQKVIVGSIQSLSTPPISLKRSNPDMYAKRMQRAKQFQAIMKNAELLLVDECDRAVSKQYRIMFRHYFNGRYKYGFSATPFDVKKPVQNLILKEHMGSVIVDVDRRHLEELGRIIPIKFYMIVVGEDGDKTDKTAFDIAEREQIIDNPEFHHKIAKIVGAFPNDATLILVDTLNVEDLGFALEKTIPGSVFVYGKTPKSVRQKYLKLFEDRKIKCLIGGKILKRGLDLKGGVDNLIICGGGHLWSDYEQKIGRALRVNDRKWSRVFAFLFMNNYYLYKHGRDQLKAVVDMGYQSKVIFNDITVDGATFVASRFRKPKIKL
ncbi:MAG: DEAD/DEAH box helicase family protein [Nitrososphaerales archaeon]